MLEMKIGIITLPLHTNYGGIIQAYALMNTLQSLDHDVVKLKIKHVPLNFVRFFLHEIFMKLLGESLYHKLYSKIKNRKDETNLRQFKNHYICNSRTLYRIKNRIIGFNREDVSCIVIGSDQVWRIRYVGGSIGIYFGDFTKQFNIKRITYGASFGTEDKEFSLEQQKKCGELIRLFDAVSVREMSGINMIKDVYEWKCKEPVHVLDPTMLLTSTDYIRLFEKANIPPFSGNLFYYILDMTDDKQKVINLLSESTSYIPYSIYQNEQPDKVPAIEKWLRGFHDAEFVITDSFHGCVFSIIFNKPFIVYSNETRGLARFESILNMFQLQNRCISNSLQLNNEIIQQPVDWISVNRKWEEMKKVSIDFLQNNLQ
jgi:hypothetical protein